MVQECPIEHRKTLASNLRSVTATITTTIIITTIILHRMLAQRHYLPMIQSCMPPNVITSSILGVILTPILVANFVVAIMQTTTTIITATPTAITIITTTIMPLWATSTHRSILGCLIRP